MQQKVVLHDPYGLLLLLTKPLLDACNAGQTIETSLAALLGVAGILRHCYRSEWYISGTIDWYCTVLLYQSSGHWHVAVLCAKA